MARPEDRGLEHTWRLRLRRQATSGLSITEFSEASRRLHRLVLRLEATARRAAGHRTIRPALVRPDPPRSYGTRR